MLSGPLCMSSLSSCSASSFLTAQESSHRGCLVIDAWHALFQWCISFIPYLTSVNRYTKPRILGIYLQPLNHVQFCVIPTVCHRRLPLNTVSLSSRSLFCCHISSQRGRYLTKLNCPICLCLPLHLINHQLPLYRRQHVHQSRRTLCGLPLHLLQPCRGRLSCLRTSRSCRENKRGPGGLHMLPALHDQLATLNVAAFLSGLRLLERGIQSQLYLKLASVTNMTPTQDGGCGIPGRTMELPAKLAARTEDGILQ